MALFSKENQPATSGKWKPGQSGNPSGLSRQERYRKAIEAALAHASATGDPDETRKDIAIVQVTLCKQGDMVAIKDFNEREYGKVPAPIVGHEDHPPIQGFAWLTTPTTE